MKIYIVENVRPDLQVFASYDKALAFAKAKANRRGGPTDVWFEGARVYHTSECGGESHITIHAREIAED